MRNEHGDYAWEIGVIESIRKSGCPVVLVGPGPYFYMHTNFDKATNSMYLFKTKEAMQAWLAAITERVECAVLPQTSVERRA
jgi:hypothetical protein